MKTVESFRFSDLANAANSVFVPAKYGFDINSTSSVEFIFFRLLVGGVRLEFSPKNICVDVGRNYFRVPPRENAQLNLLGSLVELFRPDPLVRADLLNAFFQNRSNSGFYKNILIEVSHSLLEAHDRRYMQAFIHAYRAYEQLSFAFPFYYSSFGKSYSGAYSTLRDFFKDGGDSELRFGRSFIEKTVDDVVLDSKVSISFDTNDATLLRKQMTALRKFESVGIDFSTPTPTLKFREMHDLIVDVRNRYFHHLSGMGNSLTSSEMIYPDVFFSAIVEPTLNFIALIYFYMLRQRISAS